MSGCVSFGIRRDADLQGAQGVKCVCVCVCVFAQSDIEGWER